MSIRSSIFAWWTHADPFTMTFGPDQDATVTMMADQGRYTIKVEIDDVTSIAASTISTMHSVRHMWVLPMRITAWRLRRKIRRAGLSVA